jgi:uncharacterized membrane protein YedE/YeeE
VTEGRVRRLRSMIEAGLWVGTLTWLALWLFGLTVPLPPAPPPGWQTLAGGGLLGLGALVNRACVVGTVARIGSGEWAFLFTPIGIFAASLAFATLAPPLPFAAALSPNPLAGPMSAALLGLLLLPAIADLFEHRRNVLPRLKSKLSGPHAATACIGLCFAALSLIGSPWNYSNALEHLARTGMADQPLVNLALIATLLGGAVLGGRLSRLSSPPQQRLTQCARCLAGGATMATGALLVPGSNDSLLLHAAPMLFPHALIALAAMASTIAAGRLAGRQLG